MPTPHKHAAVIKAWADGYKVQQHSKVNGMWEDVLAESPRWHKDYEYRVKPNTIKYRNFLWKSAVCSNAHPTVVSVTEVEYTNEPREHWAGFIRWIGDWQEVEVCDKVEPKAPAPSSLTDDELTAKLREAARKQSDTTVASLLIAAACRIVEINDYWNP